MTAPARAEALRHLAGMSAAGRAGAIAAAVESLRAGRLVAFPTETVYGLGASAAIADGPRRLGEAAPRPATLPPAAWHAPSADAARELLALTSPIHRRLTRRLLPGPVTFIVEKPRDDLERLRVAVGAAAGTLDNGRELALRVPDHPVAHEFLAEAMRAGHPVIAEGVARAGWGDGTRLRPPVPGAVDLALDDGPTRIGRPSSVVRLLAAGGFQVVSVGAVEERYLRKQAERTILFVCTGNTCRSPMAAAIARDLLAKRAETGDPASRAAAASTTVRSAGVSAVDGLPATPETLDAVRAVGIDPAELAKHRSHELTRQLLAEADVVYAMTTGHARAILAASPSARVSLLDPAGEDIPDPIGHPQEVYTQTARHLKEAIEKRLAEPEP